MINYKKINFSISKILELAESLSKLNKEELKYLKTAIEIKLKLDELEQLEKRWNNMQINVNTDLDEELKKTEQILTNLKLIEDKSKALQFITIRDLEKLLGCSNAIAQEYFNLPDFPATDFPKEKKAEINAVRLFFSVPRRKKEMRW